jgi:DNA-binding transcriptional ArsR family regulator
MAGKGLLAVFRKNPVVKIVRLLAGRKHEEFTKEQIARAAGLSRANLFLYWPALARSGIIRQTRRVGRTGLYALDPDSEVTRAYLAFEAALLKREIELHKAPEG